jgi:hypothetical protein
MSTRGINQTCCRPLSVCPSSEFIARLVWTVLETQPTDREVNLQVLNEPAQVLDVGAPRFQIRLGSALHTAPAGLPQRGLLGGRREPMHVLRIQRFQSGLSQRLRWCSTHAGSMLDMDVPRSIEG